MKNIKTLLGGVIFFSLPITTFAYEWTPTLEPANQGGFRAPTEIFRINFPADVPQEVYTTLALELDNIDISAMVSRKDSYVYFTSAQPLKWGKHTLRLVEYTEDGSINEKGYWDFEVRSETVFQEVDYGAEISLVASQRVADKNIGVPEPTGFTGQGSANIQAHGSNSDWDINGKMNLIYNSQAESASNNKKLDLGEYLITGQSSAFNFNLGHYSLNQYSLVMDGYSRRGASGRIGFDSLNSAVTGFVMRPEQITGFNHGLGIGDAENSISGVSWESQPLSKHPEHLYIAATYLNGKSNNVGASVGALPIEQKGEAGSLVVESAVLSQQLRLRAELATSTNDIATIDTTDTDFNNAKGDGVAFFAMYSPQPNGTDSAFSWNAGFDQSKVDSLFSSIANPGLPNDKKLRRLFVNTYWPGIVAQFSTAQERDNIDEDITKPQIENRFNLISLNYNLIETPAKGSLFDIVGAPSLVLQVSENTQKQIKAAIIPTGEQSARNRLINISANFNKEKINWGGSLSESSRDDDVNVLNDSVTKRQDLNLNYQIDKHVGITLMLQSDNTHFDLDNSDSTARLYDLGMLFHFTDTLAGHLNLNQSLTESESVYNLQDREITMASLQLVWNWILARKNKPGFDVTWSGFYIDTKDNLSPGNDLVTYQVNVGLAMSLPLGQKN